MFVFQQSQGKDDLNWVLIRTVNLLLAEQLENEKLGPVLSSSGLPSSQCFPGHGQFPGESCGPEEGDH